MPSPEGVREAFRSHQQKVVNAGNCRDGDTQNVHRCAVVRCIIPLPKIPSRSGETLGGLMTAHAWRPRDQHSGTARATGRSRRRSTRGPRGRGPRCRDARPPRRFSGAPTGCCRAGPSRVDPSGAGRVGPPGLGRGRPGPSGPVPRGGRRGDRRRGVRPRRPPAPGRWRPCGDAGRPARAGLRARPHPHLAEREGPARGGHLRVQRPEGARTFHDLAAGPGRADGVPRALPLPGAPAGRAVQLREVDPPAQVAFLHGGDEVTVVGLVGPAAAPGSRLLEDLLTASPLPAGP